VTTIGMTVKRLGHTRDLGDRSGFHDLRFDLPENGNIEPQRDRHCWGVKHVTSWGDRLCFSVE
jgi:hypothetical protein